MPAVTSGLSSANASQALTAVAARPQRRRLNSVYVIARADRPSRRAERDDLGFARVVQIGWCAFAANGDVLERMELYISDAPPCQQRAVDVHGLTAAVLAERGMPLADVLRQFSVALRRLRHDGGLLVAHLLENDAALLQGELQRAGAVDDAALLTDLATDGVCTMQAAAAQQRFRGGSVAAALMQRSDEQLRQSFNHRLYAIKLSNACRMYGVVQPAEKEGYRAHCAMYDAELAGRLYFVMRGIAFVAGAAAPRCVFRLAG